MQYQRATGTPALALFRVNIGRVELSSATGLARLLGDAAGWTTAYISFHRHRAFIHVRLTRVALRHHEKLPAATERNEPFVFVVE